MLPLSIGLLSALLLAGSSNFSSGLQAVSARQTIAVRHVPEAVLNGSAAALGPLDPRQHLSLFITLPLRNPTQLGELLHDLYESGSPSYHRFLSATEFTRRFGPTGQDYGAVIAWASANGLNVTDVTANRLMVSVDASVGAINRAFRVRMTRFRHSTQARVFYAPDREPTVTGLNAALLQIAGMSDYSLPHESTSEVAATQLALTGSGPSGYFLPGDLRAAYYGEGPLTGAGQTIGLVELKGYRASDWQSYLSQTGTATTVPIMKVLVDGYSDPCDTGGTCQDGEAVGDIVFAIGMAPGLSALRAYVYPNNEVPILAQIAAENLCSVVSVSWSFGDANEASDDQFISELAAQGQSLVHASGDDGTLKSSQATFFDVHPEVTQVGGTLLTTSGPNGAWNAETAWSGSGGGYLGGTAIPTYQQLPGVINAPNGGSTTLRNIPDVALVAAGLVGWRDGGGLVLGSTGTSFSAPLFAGYLALANQASVSNGRGRVGTVNGALYYIGLQQPTAFHDITSGSNGSFSAVAGYDLVSGWGTPTNSLISQLAGSPSSARLSGSAARAGARPRVARSSNARAQRAAVASDDGCGRARSRLCRPRRLAANSQSPQS